jgi:hypothetical protein
MLSETLLRIPFSVIGQCSLVQASHWLQGNAQELTCHRRLPHRRTSEDCKKIPVQGCSILFYIQWHTTPSCHLGMFAHGRYFHKSEEKNNLTAVVHHYWAIFENRFRFLFRPLIIHFLSKTFSY